MTVRVLVVDDDKSMVDTLSDILLLKGWTPVRAFSGEEAVSKASESRPDVVLMDIKMQGMNGVETLRVLRREHPALKVVLMTAYSAASLVEEARAAGAIDVLSKPVSPAGVLKLLGSLATSSRRVLVLEDNPTFLDTLASAIEHSGFEVARSASLDEALEQLDRDDAAVVLMDMILPGTEPEQCVAAIREVSPSVAFILYSGYPDALVRTRERLPNEWVCACLQKPFAIEELIGALHDCAS